MIIQQMPFGTYFKFKGALWHKLPDGTGYRRIGSSSPDGLNIPHPLYDEGEPVDMEAPIKRGVLNSGVQASNAHKVVLPQFVTLTITEDTPGIQSLLQALRATGKVTVSKLE